MKGQQSSDYRQLYEPILDQKNNPEQPSLIMNPHSYQPNKCLLILSLTLGLLHNMIEVMKSISIVVVQLLSCVLLYMAPWAAARQASLSSTISWSLLKFMSIESVMLSNRIFLCFLTHIKFSQETHKVV